MGRHDDFIKHLERASNTVKQWPVWKQKAWGPILNNSEIKDNTKEVKEDCKVTKLLYSFVTIYFLLFITMIIVIAVKLGT